jgi:hypothetical protein
MTILTTLPVATFGGLLTLFLFRSQLSLYSYIGIFMLLGIVAKNGIMMVDFANVNMEKGKNACELAQALVDAANAAGGPDNVTVIVVRLECRRKIVEPREELWIALVRQVKNDESRPVPRDKRNILPMNLAQIYVVE